MFTRWFCTKRATWTMRSLCLVPKRRSPRRLVWSTAPWDSSGSSTSTARLGFTFSCALPENYNLRLFRWPAVAGSLQGFGLPEWEEQSTGLCVTSSGGRHSLPSGSHLLLPASWGRAGARREADQTSLTPQQTEPLSGGGEPLTVPDISTKTEHANINIATIVEFFSVFKLLVYCDCYANNRT